MHSNRSLCLCSLCYNGAFIRVSIDFIVLHLHFLRHSQWTNAAHGTKMSMLQNGKSSRFVVDKLVVHGSSCSSRIQSIERELDLLK